MLVSCGFCCEQCYCVNICRCCSSGWYLSACLAAVFDEEMLRNNLLKGSQLLPFINALLALLMTIMETFSSFTFFTSSFFGCVSM